MNGKKMSGEITGRKVSGKNKKMIGTNMNNTSEEITGANRSGNSVPGKKKFSIVWLLPVVVLTFFLAQFWSYAPVFRGIVSLFAFSKFLAGLCGTHFLQ